MNLDSNKNFEKISKLFNHFWRTIPRLTSGIASASAHRTAALDRGHPCYRIAKKQNLKFQILRIFPLVAFALSAILNFSFGAFSLSAILDFSFGAFSLSAILNFSCLGALNPRWPPPSPGRWLVGWHWIQDGRRRLPAADWSAGVARTEGERWRHHLWQAKSDWLKVIKSGDLEKSGSKRR